MENSQAGRENADQKRFSDSGLSSFIDMLVHDDRNSFFHIARFAPDGTCSTFSRSAKYLKEFEFDAGYDWYITRNGFSSRKERSARTCRQLNSFFFDIDTHGTSDPAYVVALTLEAIDAAVNAKALPEPTMVVSTGRGLHLYYAFARSTSTMKRGGVPNAAGTRYYSDVYRKLARVIKAHIDSIPDAELDTSVFDDARISRVPGTFNSKNGAVCEVVRSSGIYHTLASINEAIPKQSPVKLAPEKRGGARIRRTGRFAALGRARMAKIEALQAHRDYDSGGTRELMCFVYYNSAIQVYEKSEDAFEATRKLNERFRNPLDESELAGIERSVSRVGFYRMSAQRIAEKLALTKEEAQAVGFYASKRSIKRQAAKEATRRKRHRRNGKIAFLKNMKLVNAEIASIVGCSVRTIYNADLTGEEKGIGLDEATELVLLARKLPSTPSAITTKKETAANFLQREPAGVRRQRPQDTPDEAIRGQYDPGGT